MTNDLKDFFSMIISEQWLADKTFSHYSSNSNNFKQLHGLSSIKKNEITFDYNKITHILLNEGYEEEHYLIGKTPQYYFLATQHGKDVYPVVKIIKHEMLGPLIPQIKHFSKMHPNIKSSAFSKSILLKYNLDESLEKKSKTKVKKI